MGLDYSASAFYGTFAPTDSEVGEALSRFIEHGTPGRTDAPDIVIDEVGSQPTGDTFVVVRHKDDHHASRLGGSRRAPSLLSAPTMSKSIATWLIEQEIDPSGMPPIGWYFAASVG